MLNVAFGQPTIAVGHAYFSRRQPTGHAPGKDPDAVEAKLVKFTPEEFKRNAHHWLILHGRYVCIARTPKCPQCVINDLCEYKDKTRSLSGMPALRSLPLKPPAGNGGSKAPWSKAAGPQRRRRLKIGGEGARPQARGGNSARAKG